MTWFLAALLVMTKTAPLPLADRPDAEMSLDCAEEKTLIPRMAMLKIRGRVNRFIVTTPRGLKDARVGDPIAGGRCRHRSTVIEYRPHRSYVSCERLQDKNVFIRGCERCPHRSRVP